MELSWGAGSFMEIICIAYTAYPMWN